MSGIGDLDNLISMLDERAKRRKAELKPKDASPAAPADAMKMLADMGAAVVQATAAAAELASLRDKHEELQDELAATRKQLTDAKEAAARRDEIEERQQPHHVQLHRDDVGFVRQLTFECDDEIRRLDVKRDRANHIMGLVEGDTMRLKVHRGPDGRIASVELPA